MFLVNIQLFSSIYDHGAWVFLMKGVGQVCIYIRGVGDRFIDV